MTLLEATATVRRHLQTGVAVDTNLLLLFWLGSYDQDLVGGKRLRQYTLEDFDLICQLVKPLSTLVVTPHVLTEVVNLTGHLSEGVAQECRAEIAGAILASEERTSMSAQIARRAEFPRLGLTDSALLELASGGTLLLTDDLPLYLAACKADYPVLYFTHLRGHLYRST